MLEIIVNKNMTRQFDNANEALPYLEDWVNRTKKANVKIKLDSGQVINTSSTEKAVDFIKPLVIDILPKKPIDYSKLDEPILEDDYPVYAGYAYVVNDKPVMWEGLFFHDNVRNIKIYYAKKLNLSIDNIVVRRCDIFGRGLY